LIPDVLLIEQNLPLEIRQFDQIAVHKPQCSHTRSHQLLGNHASQRAAPHQQHARPAQTSLPLAADLRQNRLTMVPIHFHEFHPLAPTRGGLIVAALTRNRMPVDTQQIMDEASKLGDIVAQHPAVIRYKDARSAIEKDPDATRLLAEFDRQLEALGRQQQSGMPVTDAQQQSLQVLQNKIVSHLKIKAMNLAQVEFTDLLRRITQTIQGRLNLQDAPAEGAGGGPRLSGLQQG
jgi:cell fate (sporulation/competence/biofilm development) regulator YlbF (YheA/YmcA/DUF963 family)